ncbi:MAG: hypothetical protein Q4C81_04100 [Kocuria sp.]|nr:hypothetical protein [Kocuria sp.]
MTTVHPLRDVLSGSAPPADAAEIAQQIQLQTAAALLPEQEWCEDCSRDDDPVADPEGDATGMPQDVVDRSIEPLALPADWDPEWGAGPLYDVARLACGHTVSRPAS